MFEGSRETSKIVKQRVASNQNDPNQSQKLSKPNTETLPFRHRLVGSGYQQVMRAKSMEWLPGPHKHPTPSGDELWSLRKYSSSMKLDPMMKTNDDSSLKQRHSFEQTKSRTPSPRTQVFVKECFIDISWKHEVETLQRLVATLSDRPDAQTPIDVGLILGSAGKLAKMISERDERFRSQSDYPFHNEEY